jgi:hypothetical protein
MSDHEQPHWDLLPRHPAEFFELPAEYDLVELKRRYHALIRRFKPERFPAEFQKIRAAYERLSDALRYTGLPSASRPDGVLPIESAPKPASASDPSSNLRWSPPGVGTPNADTAAARDRADRQRGLADRLDGESVPALYAELRDRCEKSPQEFVHLALLSDVVAPDDLLGFPRWLLSGIEAARAGSAGTQADEQALWRILREYFAGPVPAGQIPELLELAAARISGDRFYWLTESLWLRYLRESEFPAFHATLKSCESRVVDVETINRVSFYARLLPAAMWNADKASIQEMYSWTDGAFQTLGLPDERALQLVDLTVDYHAHRVAFLDGSRARHQIDRALAEFCLSEPVGSQRAMLVCHSWLAHHPNEVREAFSTRYPPPAASLRLWWYASHELNEELQVGADDWEPETRNEHVSTFLRQWCGPAAQCPIARAYDGFLTVGWFGLLGVIALLIVNLGRAVVQAITGGDWSVVLWSLLGMVGILAAVVVGLVIAMLILGALVERQQYAGIYRPALVAFLRDARASFDDMINAIRDTHHKQVAGKRLNDSQDVARFMSADPGLRIHANAWRVLRCEAGFNDHSIVAASPIEGLEPHRWALADFLDGSEMRRRIHDALLALGERDPADARQLFLECQSWLVDHPDDLQREFEGSKSEFESVLDPWRRFADELQKRTRHPPRDAEKWTTRDRAMVLVRRLAEVEDNDVIDRLGGGVIMLLIAIVVVVLVAIGYQCARSAWVGDYGRAAIKGLAMVAWLAVSAKLLLLDVVGYYDWYARILYRRRWRKEAFLLVSSDVQRIEVICDELAKLEDVAVQGRKFDLLPKFVELVRDDAALEFFAIARSIAR